LAGLAAAPGVVIVAPPLVELVYGSQFVEAGRVLQILAIGLLGIFPTQVCVNFLIARGKQVTVVGIDAISAVWQLTVDLVLVTRLGIDGVAIGMASSEILMTVLFLVAASRDYQLPQFRRLLPAIAAAAAMTAAAAVISAHTVWWLAIPIGALVYPALLLLCRGTSLHELQLTNILLRRRPD
ncbi:MAG: polysaccharide biosynthesis C-terminal domain-containing protein, partial [Chloroflexi bacterium]|nr:polysaccharide biosynthesis C-terminal domain-containing protein [Chloroflexota bacterium]